jgi:mannose-6-phosphate isomerase-like protein (cupin superfamily)
MSDHAEHTNSLWFFDTLVSIHAAANAGVDRISLIEHRAPYADSAPLHVHVNEDEVFYILEGEVHIHTAQGDHYLSAGQSLLAPKGLPHTYRVESRAGARWLTVTTHGEFERFVRALGRPAERIELPPPADEPTDEEMQLLITTARDYGIEIVGPPLHS